MDKNVGHFRRYDRGQLLQIAKQCNLKVLDNFYFNFMGILPYYLKGAYGRDKGGSFSSGLNEKNSNFYNFATKILKPIERKVRPSNGISEFIIMSKDE